MKQFGLNINFCSYFNVKVPVNNIFDNVVDEVKLVPAQKLLLHHEDSFVCIPLENRNWTYPAYKRTHGICAEHVTKLEEYFLLTNLIIFFSLNSSLKMLHRNLCQYSGFGANLRKGQCQKSVLQLF